MFAYDTGEEVAVGDSIYWCTYFHDEHTRYWHDLVVVKVMTRMARILAWNSWDQRFEERNVYSRNLIKRKGP